MIKNATFITKVNGIELYRHNDIPTRFALTDGYRSDWGRWDPELELIVWEDGYWRGLITVLASRKAKELIVKT